MSTLTVDARKLTHSGIGRYLRNLLPGVLPLLEAERIQILGRPDEIALLGPLPPNTSVVESDAAPHSAAEQALAWHPRLRGDGVLWVPHYNVPLLYRGRLVVTIHDLAPLELRETFGPASRLAAEVLLRHAVRRSEAILTPSHFTRDRLVARLDARPERIHVTPLAVDAGWPALAEAPPPHVEGEPYLLFVGNLKPNKNVSVLLQAMALLAGQCPYRLLIAGRMGGFRTVDRRARELAASLGNRVRLLGAVSDAELISLYRGAAALVMPSLYEGFGLPVLEAMRYGCPVLCSDAASLPEVAGDAAVLFPARDPNALAEAIRKLTQAGMVDLLRQRGYCREDKFWFASPIKVTAATLNRVLR